VRTEAVDPRTLQLERYLHEHIPISRAMGVEVVTAAMSGVRLRAPLAPNLNHRSTVFGGSAAAVATLAGWALLQVRLSEDGHASRIVIQRSSVEYTQPIDGDFEAESMAPTQDEWDRFERMLERKGRARIDVRVELQQDGRVAGRFAGTFVVLPVESDS
jgi:thioesterase domain-containing protein